MAPGFLKLLLGQRPGNIRKRLSYPHPLPRPWITSSIVRTKHPVADLKLQYPKAFGISLLFSSLLLTTIALLFPELEIRPYTSRPEPVIITLEDIPETYQKPQPPPEEQILGHAEVEGTAVVDTVEEKKIDLDFLANLNIDNTLDNLNRLLDEDAVEFWAVSKEPVLIREVLPAYPTVAREAGLEGVVFVKFAVGSDGRVKEASILKGPRLFHEPALEAVYQFVFKPAIQNDKPIAVWMTLPIRFRLVDDPLHAQPPSQTTTPSSKLPP